LDRGVHSSDGGSHDAVGLPEADSCAVQNQHYRVSIGS
jgi:hypothetical protein